MKATRRGVIVSALAALTLLAAALSRFDAARDFTIESNPGREGVWTYGWEKTLGGELHPFARSYDTTYWGGRVIGWSLGGRPQQDEELCCPLVLRNISGKLIKDAGISIAPGQLTFHPGRRGEYSVVRWQPPAPGEYSVEARFVGLDQTTSDVHILKNGVTLGEETVNGRGVSHDFSFDRIQCYPSDKIDFTVGFGDNRNYYNDLTGLSVTIELLPPA